MGLIASSILVQYSLLDQSSNVIFAGNSSTSLRLWGAQLDLAEYSDQVLQDYINNFRYIRTLSGIEQNWFTIRIGLDQTSDFVVTGYGQAFKTSGGILENAPFYVNLNPRRGIGTGTQNVSGNTVTGADYDRVYTGQQSGTIRNAGDPLECVVLNLQTLPPPMKIDSVAVRTDLRAIPQVPKYDAPYVAGLNLVYKTDTAVNYNLYTPLSGTSSYYHKYAWYSEVPIYSRSKKIGRAHV